MRRGGILALVLLATACGEEPPPSESREQADRDVAMVEAANHAPPPQREVVPEPIGYPDMERHQMFGAACKYAPGTSAGTRVIAREADAFIKVGGEVMRLAADPGSRELPLHTRALYDGRVYSLVLSIGGAGAPAARSGSTDYQGNVELRDGWGRAVYTGAGLVRCTP